MRRLTSLKLLLLLAMVLPRYVKLSVVVTGWLAEQYNEYIQLYEQDPFSADTITAGDELAQALTVEQRKTWQTLIENTDMTHNSMKAWSLIKKLSNDPRKADQHVNVTPNQVAHQLILNGKVPNRQRQSKIKRCGQENHDFDDDFTIIELQTSLKHLKNGKAAGLDKILTEEIKNFGPVTTQWVLNLLNACARTHRLPRLWRQARVVAILKPGKDPSSPKSFRPISLLCHLYKLCRAPDTEPPVSHYRTHPDTRAGWLPPRQILYCPGFEPHPAYRRWL